MSAVLENVSVVDELRDCYLEYSVAIFNRALPSVNDGLKQAQRRIILGLKDLNLRPTGQYKKVSRLEGHVLGLYHPQGACAGTAINMGQSSAFRYKLTDIHGNTGGCLQDGPSVGQSTSEDGPAAARYLEIRATALVQRLMIDEIDKQSCQWRANYDDSTQEVVEIIPALPALLINGATGIAAGYACNHASYNLAEVIRGTVAYIKNQKITPGGLQKLITAPDLPNGARILNDTGIANAFAGSGSLKVYGEWIVKKVTHGKRTTRDAIVITKLASGSSEKFTEKLREGVDSEKITGVVDCKDLSSQAGIEILVVLKAGAVPTDVVSQLLAFTNLYDTVSVNATAIANGLPRQFSVLEIIHTWYESRCTALSARYVAESAVLADKIHILEGLLVVLADIDEVVKLIRSSSTKDIAANRLKKRWGLSDAQAAAVLLMPLSKLLSTETLELQQQSAELTTAAATLDGLVADSTKMAEHIIEQVSSLKEFADRRRSVVVSQDEIGVGVAKTTTAGNGIRRVKLPTVKDLIKKEARELKVKRVEMAKFWLDNAKVKDSDLKPIWAAFKKARAHQLSLTTRAGRAERKAALEGMKAAAIKRGLPQRGQHCWRAFYVGRESETLDNIEIQLKEWMANIG